jgi:[ribosomal protein S5]-alanine N-acetyltransferase
MQRPTLRTDRLLLRPFELSDAPDVQRLAGAREIALNTELVPHPYPDGAAEEWISTHQQAFDERSAVGFAITSLETRELIGAIGLVLTMAHDRGEIGYWIGVPFWGRGIATEAARAVIQYGFNTMGLHRIEALHFTRNPDSGRVLQKLGMQYEGRRRHWMKKWDEYQDVDLYAVLRE